MRGLVTRTVRAVLKRWGSSAAKSKVWDLEYLSGAWDFLDARPRAPEERDIIYSAIQHYADAAKILDLGCGTGSTALECDADFSLYLGVDISEAAITRANTQVQRLTSRSQTSRQINFIRADISTFIPHLRFDVIIYREVLQYFPTHKARELLRHYEPFIADEGVCIVRLHNRIQSKSLIEMIKHDYKVLDIIAPIAGNAIVIVFQKQDKLGVSHNS